MQWQIWKLHTVWDYVFFFMIVALGLVVYRIAVGWLNQRRNLPCAAERVEKRMKKVLGQDACTFRMKKLRTGSGELPFDLLCVAEDRVYNVKVFPFGLKVSGGANVPQWQFADNRTTVKEKNPVPAMRDLKSALGKTFASAGLKDVPVEPLIVFADNWGNTKFHVEGVNYAVSFVNLKNYLKNMPKKFSGSIDREAVRKCLEQNII